VEYLHSSAFTEGEHRLAEKIKKTTRAKAARAKSAAKKVAAKVVSLVGAAKEAKKSLNGKSVNAKTKGAVVLEHVSAPNGQSISKRELILAGKIKGVFCETCGTVQPQTFVGEWQPSDRPREEDEPVETERKYWLRCDNCSQVQLVEEWKIQLDREKKLDDLKKDDCITYSPQGIYAVGDAVYHAGLNEVGIVRTKLTTASGMNAVTIEFRALGTRQLLENVSIDPNGAVVESGKKARLKLLRKTAKRKPAEE
jgi:hypothetical protein